MYGCIDFVDKRLSGLRRYVKAVVFVGASSNLAEIIFTFLVAGMKVEILPFIFDIWILPFNPLYVQQTPKEQIATCKLNLSYLLSMNHKHSSFLDPNNTDTMDIHYIQCSTSHTFLHVKH